MSKSTGLVFKGYYPRTPYQGSLAVNGGFEDGDPSTGWTLDGAGATFVRDNTHVYSGSYAGKLTRNGTDCRAYYNIGTSGVGNQYSNGMYGRIGGLRVENTVWTPDRINRMYQSERSLYGV